MESYKTPLRMTICSIVWIIFGFLFIKWFDDIGYDMMDPNVELVIWLTMVMSVMTLLAGLIWIISNVISSKTKSKHQIKPWQVFSIIDVILTISTIIAAIAATHPAPGFMSGLGEFIMLIVSASMMVLFVTITIVLFIIDKKKKQNQD